MGLENKVSQENRIKTCVLSRKYTIFLDEVFTEPAYEREVLTLLNDVNDNDIVVLMVNSGGGTIKAGLPIVTALRHCKAHTKGVLMCEAHSMASVILLCCDEYEVYKHTSMLVHTCSYGTYGKVPEVAVHVAHQEERLERMFKDVYKGFLSESDIEYVLGGKDLYLNYDQICYRLENKIAADTEHYQEMADEDTLPSAEALFKMTKKDIIKLIHPKDSE